MSGFLIRVISGKVLRFSRSGDGDIGNSGDVGNSNAARRKFAAPQTVILNERPAGSEGPKSAKPSLPPPPIPQLGF